MPKTNSRLKEDPQGRDSPDFDSLKRDFTEFGHDATKLLEDALVRGRRGQIQGSPIGNGASVAAARWGAWRILAAARLTRLSRKIGQRPLLRAAMALGIGFFLARLFRWRR